MNSLLCILGVGLLVVAPLAYSIYKRSREIQQSKAHWTEQYIPKFKPPRKRRN
jgi:hypothetical protein